MDYKDDLKHRLPWRSVMRGWTAVIVDSDDATVPPNDAAETVNRQAERFNELALQIVQLKAQLRWSNNRADAMKRDIDGLLRSIEQGVDADVVEIRLREIAAYGDMP